MLEDFKNHNFLCIETAFKTIKIISISSRNLISIIYPPSNISSAPMKLSLSFTSSHSYLIVLHDNYSFIIYDYETTKLISIVNLSYSESFTFVEILEPEDYFILFSSSTILKYTLSDDG